MSDMSSTQNQVGQFWSAMYQNATSEKIAWWHSETALRHVNALVCDVDTPPIWSAGIARLLEKRLHGRRLKMGVSIGFGNGKKELMLLEMGLVERFMLFELSAEAIEIARKNAKNAGLLDRVELFLEDAFRHDFRDVEVDLVHWNNSLHHMFDVKDAVRWSHDLLVPGGVFYMDDYVGVNRFKNPPHVVDILNELINLIPLRYRQFPDFPGYYRLYLTIGAPEDDPSEAVDSERIVESVRHYFPQAEIIPTGGAVYFYILTGLFRNFDEQDPDDLAILKQLLTIDTLYTKPPHSITAYAVAIAFK